MIRVYISAPFPLRAEARRLASDLLNDGIEHTSRWIFEDDILDARAAQKDLDDVARADILILINPPDWANQGTGGRHVELGYGLALRKPILLVGGHQSNLFHYHVDVIPVEDHALFNVIRRIGEVKGLL